MTFLTPLFLVALAGLAIPVVIHLIQREKKDVVQFPSLMFLQRIPYQSIRRRRVRNWLLLLLRMAALALLVFAFARPFIQRSERALAATGSREVVVLLDRSYSMAYGDRWDRARAAARETVAALDADDRASLVLFSSDAEVAVRSSVERPRLTAAIDAAEVSSGATRFAPALKVAGSVLSDSELPRLEVVLISDFQRGGWLGGDAVQLPPTATVTPIAIVGGPDLPNATVAGVSLERSRFSNQERVTVTASFRNHMAEAMPSAEVRLELGGRPIQTERVALAADGSASVTFAPFTVDQQNMRGSVRVGSDALERDNVLHFVVSPPEPLRVLVVDAGGASSVSSLYLRRALAIGEAPRFEVDVRRPDEIPEELVTRAGVVVLNDVAVPRELAEWLDRFVEQGGGLMMAAGPRTSWPLSSAALMPASLGAPVDRTQGDPARLGAVQYGHPVFEVFRAPRSGDFSSARFYGYRLATPSKTATVLARFDAGAPALIEQTSGRGQVLMWTTSLDLHWNDLPLKPVYLPFVHRALRHLATYVEPRPWMTVGQALDASSINPRQSVPVSMALAPSGERLSVGGEGAGIVTLTEQGFYEIRGETPGSESAVVAVNVDVGESDLVFMDPLTLVAAARAAPAVARTTTGATAQSPAAQERAQRLWWYLLVAAIVLFGAETIFSNRLSKA